MTLCDLQHCYDRNSWKVRLITMKPDAFLTAVGHFHDEWLDNSMYNSYIEVHVSEVTWRCRGSQYMHSAAWPLASSCAFLLL